MLIKRMCLRWLLSVFAYFAIWRLCIRGLPCACGYFGYPALVGWRVGKVGTSTGNARNEKARCRQSGRLRSVIKYATILTTYM